MAIVTKMNMLLSLTLRRMSPHHVRRSWSCYFSSVAAAKTSCEEDLVAAFSSWNCIGSSHGWLGYVSPHCDSFYLFKPSLLNHPSYLPFIPLPPLPSWHHVSKMIFSSSPTPIQRQAPGNDTQNSSVLVVLTLDLVSRGAKFCRMGDPGWVSLSSNLPVSEMPMKRGKYLCSHNCFQDIAYDSKHNLFYVTTNSGEIYSWNLSNYRHCSINQSQDYSKIRYLSKPPTTEFPPPDLSNRKHLNHGIKYYLVMDESSRSLLLIRVLIYYTGYDDCDLPDQKSYVHDVHCLDVDNKLDSEWFPLRGLVDTALFIGRNNGILVDLRKVPGLVGLVTPGYIYLACDAFGFFQLNSLCFSSWAEIHSTDYMSILRAHEMTKTGHEIKSFPVWNFE